MDRKEMMGCSTAACLRHNCACELPADVNGLSREHVSEIGAEGKPARLVNEPASYGIGLQACRLEVHAASQLMGSSPTVFEAPAPWWRQPD